jgi:hypothetical protein
VRALAAVIPLALAAALGGCGAAQSSAGNFEGEQKAVAEAVEDLQVAAQTRKPEEICADLLARSLADRIKTSGGDCVKEMDKAVRDADDFEIDVTRVTITGATARALARTRQRGREKQPVTFTLAREDGRWRLTNLGGGL